MNSEHLRYFGQLYELRSYGAAARRASITSTGLLKAMQSLERALKAELFTKDDLGNLTPTESGDALYAFYQSYEREFSTLAESLDRIRSHRNNVLRFGSAQGMWGLMGPSFLFDLYHAHPDIRLTYREYTDYESEDGLRNERFDLAFTVAPFSRDFVTTELFSDSICFWIPTDSPLASREALVAEDFEGVNIAIPGRGFKCFDSLMRLCENAGVATGDIYEISELHRIYDFVAKGLGIGFTLSTVNEVRLFYDDPKAVCVPTRDLSLQFGISYLPYRPLTEPEQRFYDFCVHYAGLRFAEHCPITRAR
ncbi:MAG: LysR family transcriptional regulator [Coriobacteriales bacterium]|nr:LysR family transcriptional regulator [Coriobacteriales bacterium]